MRAILRSFLSVFLFIMDVILACIVANVPCIDGDFVGFLKGWLKKSRKYGIIFLVYLMYCYFLYYISRRHAMSFKEERAQKARDSIIGILFCVIIGLAAFFVAPDFQDFFVLFALGICVVGFLGFLGLPHSNDYRRRSDGAWGQYR